MPRGADRLIGKFTGSLESAPADGGHRPVRRQLSNAVYIYRHPIGGGSADDPLFSRSLTRELENATGNRLRPVGSIIRRTPMSIRQGGRTAIRRTTLPSNPPSPPLDPTLEEPIRAQRSSVPTISVANSAAKGSPERQISFMDNKSATADELMQILMEDDGTDRPILFTVFEAANIDGVKHLSSKSKCTRYTWFLLIILFICLCFYQIGAQAMMYWLTPVATNIIASYPESIPFPVVAICNNNQHRLTWITGGFVQNREAEGIPPSHFRQNLNNSDVFDKALLNTWDLDAGRFLRNAAHQKARMIVRCELPNGSRCSPRDFRPIWTLTGLCWAINTDSGNPMHVTGAGPGNALRLLVNVERYERIESCTPKLRTRSLPGLKVLIYNQTDVPTHYLEGVNIPAGFTMDIPFWMRHRQKLPGRDCVVIDSSSKQTNGNNSGKGEGEDEQQNEDLRSCIMQSYLGEIERRCNCSMRHAYLQKIDEHSKNYSECTVLQYFECVQPVLEWALNRGFVNFRHCPIPCESIDYTAWQDMTELPANIFPKLISEGQSQDDEDESDERDSSEESASAAVRSDEDFLDSIEEDEQEHYQCAHNQLLNGQHVRRIKKAAQLAFEKQARYQEDIQLRTKRLVAQLRRSMNRIVEMRWGWRAEHFLGVHLRLGQMASCYEEIPRRHPHIFNAMANPKPQGEEERAVQLLQMLKLASGNSTALGPGERKLETIEDVKRIYGQRAEEKREEMEKMEDLIGHLQNLFSEESFTERLPKSLERTMGKILFLMGQYEEGKLERKNWAERMNARNMRHFFDEDFYESWYNLVVKDLEQSILARIQQIEEELPQLHRNSENGTAILTGSFILFGDSHPIHQGFWASFLDDSLECIFNEIRNASLQMLKEFQRAMYDLQSAQIALFRKELPEYLQNFEFGPKFVRENFAQVNVFLHKMNIEHWRQEPTYSIWSFFCDIGATMSLFLGASMLTIIEVLYFVLRNTRIYKSIEFWRQRKFVAVQQKTKENEKKKGPFNV